MTYALITGASKGIGRSIALELARNRFNVLLVARSEEALQLVASEIREKYKVEAACFAIDLAAEGAATRVVNWCNEHHYEISALINNAGYGLSGAFQKYTVEEDLEMMQVNMTVPVQLCRMLLPVLSRQKQAYILNIASSAAYQAVPGLSLYAATKAFVLRFSRGLHQEFRNTSISVTCVCPGATDTGFAGRAQIGAKGLKAAEKVNMMPDQVARIAVKGMFAKKPEVITGVVNKLGAALVWMLPKILVERTAMKIYE